MTFMGLNSLGRRLLLIWVLGILILGLVYAADVAPEPKFLLLGVFVGYNITAMFLGKGITYRLFRAHTVVMDDVLKYFQIISGEMGLRGPVLNKGSTLSGFLDSSACLLEKDYALKVRNSDDKVKCIRKNNSSFNIIRGPVRSHSTLIHVSQELEKQNWLSKYSSNELLDMILAVIANNGQGINQGFLRFALNELKERLNTWQQNDVSPLFEGHQQGFEFSGVKPIVRAA